MSTFQSLRRRERVFGEGRLVPLDRNAKARIMVFARALTRRTEKGKHYGVVTAKFVAVLDALLWGFHNAASGRCFPSYERIAERAACARSTVDGRRTAIAAFTRLRDEENRLGWPPIASALENESIKHWRLLDGPVCARSRSDLGSIPARCNGLV
jgi:hypothetical protein